MRKNQGFALLGMLISLTILGIVMVVVIDRLLDIPLLGPLEDSTENAENNQTQSSSKKITVTNIQTAQKEEITIKQYNPSIHRVMNPSNLEEGTIKAICLREVELMVESGNLKGLSKVSLQAGRKTSYQICLAKFGIVESK